MKKEAIIALVAIAICAGVYAIWHRDGSSSLSTLTGSYSIQDVIATGKSMKCDFSRSDESAEVEGTLYISEGRVRGDFDITASSIAQKFQSHFLTRDGATYTWTSLLATGYKTSVVQSTSASSSPSAQASIVGLNDKVDYNCSDWEEEQGTFNIPQDVEFKSL